MVVVVVVVEVVIAAVLLPVLGVIISMFQNTGTRRNSVRWKLISFVVL